MELKLSLIKSPIDVRDWVAETIFDSTTKLPKKSDNLKRMLPVRNQGALGSCAAQVGAAMKEWQENVNVGFSAYMSPMFLYNLREDKTTEGMYSRDLMNILLKYGVCPEILYPYGSTGPISDIAKVAAKSYRIKSYAAVNTIDGLKRALLKSGPCLMAVPAYNRGNRMWKAGQGDTLLGGHSMTVVDYDETGFILRNSWSSGWNSGGYTKFPYEDWGCQWEVWCTIDDESTKPIDHKVTILDRVKGWFNSFLDWFGRITTV